MPPDGGFFIFGGYADFLIFLALHGSIDGAVYKFVHAFSALCGVIFYYLLLPLRDKNVYALNFCAISGGVFFIALIAWHLLLDLPYLWAGNARPFALPHITTNSSPYFSRWRLQYSSTNSCSVQGAMSKFTASRISSSISITAASMLTSLPFTFTMFFIFNSLRGFSPLLYRVFIIYYTGIAVNRFCILFLKKYFCPPNAL